MTIIKRVSSIAAVLVMLAAITVVLPVNAQVYNLTWTISYKGAPSAVVGQQYTIIWNVDCPSDQDNIPAGQITLTVDGSTAGISPTASPAVVAAVADTPPGVTGATYVFSTPGTHTLAIVVPPQVNLDGDGDTWLAASASTQVTVTGGAQTPQATTTPQTPQTPIATPVSQPQVSQQQTGSQNTQVSAQTATITNNFGPGTVTSGTQPVTGLPAQVFTPTTQQPGHLKQITIAYASDPAQMTDGYNKLSQSYIQNGYTLTARGQNIYNDPSHNYLYSKFSKGGSSIYLQALGNNSSQAINGIPGDVLISQSDEVYDTGGLFGLSQLATWALFIVIAVAVLAVIFFLWYRRRKKEEEEQQPDTEYQPFERPHPDRE